MESLAYLVALVLVFVGFLFNDKSCLVKHIPGPPTIPIFGNGFLLASRIAENYLRII